MMGRKREQFSRIIAARQQSTNSSAAPLHSVQNPVTSTVASSSNASPSDAAQVMNDTGEATPYGNPHVETDAKMRLQAEQELQRRYEEEQRLCIEEEIRMQQRLYEEEEQRRYEEEKRLYEEEQRRYEEERRRYEEEQRRRYEEEQRRLYEEEQRRIYEEEQRQLYEEEQRRINEEEERKQQEEEAEILRVEEEERKQQEEEAERLRMDEEEPKQQQEEAERLRLEEEEGERQEEEAERKRAEEEEERKQEEEKEKFRPEEAEQNRREEEEPTRQEKEQEKRLCLEKETEQQQEKEMDEQLRCVEEGEKQKDELYQANPSPDEECDRFDVFDPNDQLLPQTATPAIRVSSPTGSTSVSSFSLVSQSERSLSLDKSTHSTSEKKNHRQRYLQHLEQKLSTSSTEYESSTMDFTSEILVDTDLDLSHQTDTWPETPDLSMNLSDPQPNTTNKPEPPPFGNPWEVNDIDFSTPENSKEVEKAMKPRENRESLQQNSSVDEAGDVSKNDSGMSDFNDELSSFSFAEQSHTNTTSQQSKRDNENGDKLASVPLPNTDHNVATTLPVMSPPATLHKRSPSGNTQFSSSTSPSTTGGSAALAAWWQNTYAASQNADVNSVVQRALSRSTTYDASTIESSPSVTKVGKNSSGNIISREQEQNNGIAIRVSMMSSDDDDIFSGLDDDDGDVQEGGKSELKRPHELTECSIPVNRIERGVSGSKDQNCGYGNNESSDMAPFGSNFNSDVFSGVATTENPSIQTPNGTRSLPSLVDNSRESTPAATPTATPGRHAGARAMMINTGNIDMNGFGNESMFSPATQAGESSPFLFHTNGNNAATPTNRKKRGASGTKDQNFGYGNNENSDMTPFNSSDVFSGVVTPATSATRAHRGTPRLPSLFDPSVSLDSTPAGTPAATPSNRAGARALMINTGNIDMNGFGNESMFSPTAKSGDLSQFLFQTNGNNAASAIKDQQDDAAVSFATASDITSSIIGPNSPSGHSPTAASGKNKNRKFSDDSNSRARDEFRPADKSKSSSGAKQSEENETGSLVDEDEDEDEDSDNESNYSSSTDYDETDEEELDQFDADMNVPPGMTSAGFRGVRNSTTEEVSQITKAGRGKKHSKRSTSIDDSGCSSEKPSIVSFQTGGGSTQISHRAGFFSFSGFACGVLDSLTNTMCHNNESGSQKSNDIAIEKELREGEEDDYDDEKRTRRSLSIESNASGTVNTHGDTVGTPMSLSKKERKVWDDWDRKDTEFTMGDTPRESGARGSASVVSQSMLSTSAMSTSTNTLSRLSQLEERQRRAQHLERRARAHEKLLLFAYSALSVPPPSNNVEKGEQGYEAKDGKEISLPMEKEEGAIPMPEIDNPESTFPMMPQSTIIGPEKSRSINRSKSIAMQRQTLEHFCSLLRNEGMEVLKLNRDKKWQQRFLTFSKEITWLSDDKGIFGPGDRGHCPQGILWLKKFNIKNKEHGVASIGKHGKGGMFLSHLTHSSIVSSVSENYPLSKKQQHGKFKESITVSLQSDFDGLSRTVIFRCLNMEAARRLCKGCNAIIGVLKIDAIAKDRAVKKVGMAQNRIAAAELGLSASQMTQINVTAASANAAHTKRQATKAVPISAMDGTPGGMWKL